MVQPIPRFTGFAAAPRIHVPSHRMRWHRFVMGTLDLGRLLPYHSGDRTRALVHGIAAFLAAVAGAALLGGGVGTLVEALVPPHNVVPASLWAGAAGGGVALVCLAETTFWAVGEARRDLMRRLIDPTTLDRLGADTMVRAAALHAPPPAERQVQAWCCWAVEKNGLALLRCGWYSDATGLRATAWPDPGNRPFFPRATLLRTRARPWAWLLWVPDGPITLTSAAQDLHSAHARLGRLAQERHAASPRSTAASDPAPLPAPGRTV